MVSGLKVNFWKSSILGVNVSDNFMRLASVFLNCRIGGVPFKYLGLPVGASTRREATWEPLIASIRNRLGGWANKFISLGGRITLLNSVLNAIPIFYLSYLKILISVWKKIRRLQREFLWGGRGGRKKLCWVKWDAVCQPKRWGGLGVKDIRAVNISLLAKWRWRLLSNEQAVWKDVLCSKYGSLAIGHPVLGEGVRPWFASLWWKDICSIGSNLNNNWFIHGTVKKLGNGLATNFWCDRWLGDAPLRDLFPRLFSISLQQDLSITAVRRSINGIATWNLVWRRRFFEWEQALLVELMELINPVILSDADDDWGWRPEGGAAFTVKSTYNLVSSLTVPDALFAQWQVHTFASVWKCFAPSKVRGFTWQLLHGRIPTRQNLVARHVIPDGEDNSCVLCGEGIETELHLFLYCEIALLVWMEIFDWLQVPFSLPHNLFSVFNCLLGVSNRKLEKNGLTMIGCAVVWNLWRRRNKILFDEGGGNVEELVEAMVDEGIPFPAMSFL
jgi:hypothetical protein